MSEAERVEALKAALLFSRCTCRVCRDRRALDAIRKAADDGRNSDEFVGNVTRAAVTLLAANDLQDTDVGDACRFTDGAEREARVVAP